MAALHTLYLFIHLCILIHHLEALPSGLIAKNADRGTNAASKPFCIIKREKLTTKNRNQQAY